MQENYGSRAERNVGQSGSRNTKYNSKPPENKTWRNNQQSRYQVRNLDVEEVESREGGNEERNTCTEAGNE